MNNLLHHIAKAHEKAGAPGRVVGVRLDCRYVVEIDRPEARPHRRAFKYSPLPTGLVQVRPCWTTKGPDGKAVQHRKCATG